MATPQATLLGGIHPTNPHTLGADAASGEIILLGDDRAGVVTGLSTAALVSGKKTDVVVGGPVRITKASAVDLSGEKRIYWDVSADLAIAVGSAATGDFDVGGFVGGGAVGDTYVDVDLNSKAGTVAS